MPHIDFPIDLSVRRKIAEVFHNTSGQNPFIVIDQVLALYLELHQITNTDRIHEAIRKEKKIRFRYAHTDKYGAFFPLLILRQPIRNT